jgi:hypothetical protein
MQIERDLRKLRGENWFEVLGMWSECGMERRKKRSLVGGEWSS